MNKKKWWIVIGFSIVAVIAVTMVILFATGGIGNGLNGREETYKIEIYAKRLEYGQFVKESSTDTYKAGSNPRFYFTPSSNGCIKSVKVDGEEVYDYLNNKRDITQTFDYIVKDVKDNMRIDVEFDKRVTASDIKYTSYLVNPENNGFLPANLSGVVTFGEAQSDNVIKIEPWSRFFPATGSCKFIVGVNSAFDLKGFLLPGKEIVSHFDNVVTRAGFSSSGAMHSGDEAHSNSGGDSFTYTYSPEDHSFIITNLSAMFNEDRNVNILHGRNELSFYVMPKEVELNLYKKGTMEQLNEGINHSYLYSYVELSNFSASMSGVEVAYIRTSDNTSNTNSVEVQNLSEILTAGSYGVMIKPDMYVDDGKKVDNEGRQVIELVVKIPD